MELSTLLHLRRSAGRFCPYSKHEVNCYYASLASSASPHDVLTINVMIATLDRDRPLEKGTCIFATGKLHPGTRGSMLDFEVIEYTRVDKIIPTIPTGGVFTIRGSVESLDYLGKPHLVVRAPASKYDYCYFLVCESRVPSPIMDLIQPNDSVQLIGSFLSVGFSPHGLVPMVEIAPTSVTFPGMVAASTGQQAVVPEDKAGGEIEEEAVLRLLDSGTESSSGFAKDDGGGALDDDDRDWSSSEHTPYDEQIWPSSDDGVGGVQRDKASVGQGTTGFTTRRRWSQSGYSNNSSERKVPGQDSIQDPHPVTDIADETPSRGFIDDQSDDSFLTDDGLTRRLSDASLLYALSSSPPSQGASRRKRIGESDDVIKSGKRRRV